MACWRPLAPLMPSSRNTATTDQPDGLASDDPRFALFLLPMSQAFHGSSEPVATRRPPCPAPEFGEQPICHSNCKRPAIHDGG